MAAVAVLPDGVSTAAGVQSYLTIDQTRADTLEYLRNTAAAISPTMQVEILQEWDVTPGSPTSGAACSSARSPCCC